MKKSKKNEYIEQLHLKIDQLQVELSQERAVKESYLRLVNFMLNGETRKTE